MNIKDENYNDADYSFYQVSLAVDNVECIAIAGQDAQDKFESEFGDIDVPVIPVTSTSPLNGSWKTQKHQWYDIE